MIAKNKDQYQEQTNQWLQEIKTNTENKKINDC